MKVVIIGSGNVAFYLADKLTQVGHELLQVVGRNKKTASALAKKFKTGFTANISLLNQEADMYIIAVNDDSIAAVAEQMPATEKIVVHTSGSTSLKVLKKFRNTGVLYPLQSLHKQYTEKKTQFVFCIEGANAKTENMLTRFAKSLGSKAVNLNSQDRLKLHLAAVVVNNFVNYLYTLSYDFLGKNKIDFSLLAPLINHTTEKALTGNPANVQTGPALRDDLITIKKHVALLKGSKELKKIYVQFSKAIHAMHKNKT